jgi:phosphate transport system substrate-binding protein
MRISLRLAAVMVSAFVASLSAGCGGGSDTEGSGAATGGAPPAVIAIDGSSTVFPISEAVAEEFQNKNPGTQVTVGHAGTGGGFQKFCRGETAISNASRPITATEVESCKQGNVSFIELPVAYDGLAVVVNPKNSWASSMTVAELNKLWSPDAQGKVLRWNQVRSGWPDQEIHLFGAGVDSGTFDYFTEVINGKAKVSRGDYTSSEDDNVLVQGVTGDQYALGYMGLAYFEENRDKLKLVPIDDGDPANGQGPIAPSPETVRNGTYRPLSRPMFIYVNTSALNRPEVQTFVDFHLTAGEELVSEVGYVPLTDAELQLVRQRFAAKTLGSIYEPGAPVDPKVTLEMHLKGQKK